MGFGPSALIPTCARSQPATSTQLRPLVTPPSADRTRVAVVTAATPLPVEPTPRWSIVSSSISSSHSSSVHHSPSSYKMSSDDQKRWATAAPLAGVEEEGEGRFESSVNALSFGLVATAVLISIFLLLAIFERYMFIRQTPSPPFDSKLPPFPSPKMGVSEREISVLMPGEEIPTFIAQPCPPSSSRS